MVYDLATIKKYSILDGEDCEQILSRIIGELLNEDGEYEWDGIYCGPSYDDFIKVYDEEMYREYEKLQITLTDTKLYDDTDILSEADKRELYYREETGISAYEKAVADIKIDKVAVSNFNITFKDKTTNDPVTGETEEHEEINVTMTIYLVLTEGEWKSYSPTIAGAFPPLTHFTRYTVEV